MKIILISANYVMPILKIPRHIVHGMGIFFYKPLFSAKDCRQPQGHKLLSRR